MKRIFFIFIFPVLLVTACQPKAAPISTPTLVSTTSVMATAIPTTKLLVPTQLPEPTSTPELLNLPPIIENVPPHPLALNESNVATKMRRLNIYGTGALQDIKFSPDGQYLAVATSRGVYIYDGKTFELNNFIDVNDSVSAIAISPDGPILAVAVNGKVSLWNVLSGQKLSDLDGSVVRLWKLVYGKGGYVAAIGTNCRGCGSPVQIMLLWNAKTGQQIYSEDNIWYWTESLAFTSDGKKLAFGGKGGLRIIESKTGIIRKIDNDVKKGRVPEAVDFPLDIIFSYDDNHLFITSDEGDGQVLELSTQEKLTFPTCSTYLGRTDSLGVCPLSEQIVFFDLSNGKKISSKNLPGFDAANNKFAINPKGDFFVYSTPGILHIINSSTGVEVKTLFFDTFNNVQTGIVLLNGEKKTVAIMQTRSDQVTLLDLETGENLQFINLGSDKIQNFAFRPDYKTIAITNEENTLFLWDIQTEQIIYRIALPETIFGSSLFTPDGSSVLLTTNPESDVLEFNLQTGKSINHGKNSFAYDYADPFVNNNYHFNEQGNLVMLHYQNNKPTFQDVKTGQDITISLQIVSDINFIEAFAINKDGKLLAFGSPGDIFVWNMEAQKQISTLSGHEFRGGDGWMGKIRSLTFSPQSNFLVSVGWDETTRLWNIQTGQELRRLNVCCSATFTPDGRFLVTAGKGVLRVWGIP